MAFRVCALLVLMSLAGVGWCDKIIIRPATEKEQTQYEGTFTFILKNGVGGVTPSPSKYFGARSSFGCISNMSHALIQIHLGSDIKSKVFNLNISQDFGEYTNYNGNSGEISVNGWSGSICFFQGIWYPSKSVQYEVYFNIIKNDSNFDDTNGVFLRATVSGKSVTSRVTKNIRKFYLKTHMNKYQNDTQLRVNVKDKDTQNMLDEASNESRLVVGGLTGTITKQSGITVEMEKQQFSFDTDGEFHMAFLTENSIVDYDQETAINFATKGTSDTIRTLWFNVEKTDEGVTLKPFENTLKLLKNYIKTPDIII